MQRILTSHDSHKPSDIKVTLNLRTTTPSSKISLPDPSSESTPSNLYIQIHASIKHSTRPNLPITLSTWRTPLERPLNPNNDSSSPVWINSSLTCLRSTSSPDRVGGPPELGYVVHRRGGFARNLREDWDFLTIPPASSGQEVVVEHSLQLNKLQFWQSKNDGYRDEVRPHKGERFVIAPSEGALGTFWWRWGDMEEELGGKKFMSDEWYDAEKGDTHEEVKGEEWVESEGENGFGLTMEIENEAEIEFVWRDA